MTGREDDAGILVTLRETTPAARALLAGVFVNKLGAFIQVFLVLFLTARGFSGLEAGIALGGLGAGSVVGVLAGGALTDRLGPRRTIIVSMSGSAVLILAILYVHNYPGLLAAVTVVGAVGQAYRPASAGLLSELTPQHRQVMIFAMYRLALNLGTTAAPLIGAALVAVSYNLLFWGEAVAALAYAAIALVALPARAPATEPAADAEQADRAADAAGDAAGSAAGDAVGDSEGGAGRPDPGAAGRGGYRAVLADRRYTLYLLAMLVNATVYVQYLATLPLAVRGAGLAIGVYSAMIALNGFIVITCELLVTRVVQRWPARIVVAAAFVLLGGGLACYALPWGAAAFLVGTLIWSLAEIVGGPTMFAYPAQAAPGALRGRYIGSAHAMFGLGSAIGPVLGVAGWELLGRGVWVACGLASLLGLAAAWTGIRRAPAHTADDAEPADHAASAARAVPTVPAAQAVPTVPAAEAVPTALAVQVVPTVPAAQAVPTALAMQAVPTADAGPAAEPSLPGATVSAVPSAAH